MPARGRARVFDRLAQHPPRPAPGGTALLLPAP